MRTLKTLTPGQAGTKELLARYGPSLLWPRQPENLRIRLFGPAPPAQETVLEDSDGPLGVRYRYDEDTRERLKTVELEPRVPPNSVTVANIVGAGAGLVSFLATERAFRPSSPNLSDVGVPSRMG